MPRRGRNEEIPEKLSLKINGLIFLRTDNRGAVIFFRSCDDLFNNLHARHEYFLPQLYPLHLILPLQGMKVKEEDITHAPHGVEGVKKLLLITSRRSPHFENWHFLTVPLYSLYERFFAHLVFPCLNSLKHRTQYVSTMVGVIKTKSSLIVSLSSKALNRKPTKGNLENHGTAFLFSVEVLS